MVPKLVENKWNTGAQNYARIRPITLCTVNLHVKPRSTSSSVRLQNFIVGIHDLWYYESSRKTKSIISAPFISLFSQLVELKQNNLFWPPFLHQDQNILSTPSPPPHDRLSPKNLFISTLPCVIFSYNIKLISPKPTLGPRSGLGIGAHSNILLPPNCVFYFLS